MGHTWRVTTWLTACAAVAAAIFSIVNVVTTNRHNRQSKVFEWRRDSARKVFTDLLDGCRALLDAKRDLGSRFEPSFKSALDSAPDTAGIDIPEFRKEFDQVRLEADAKAATRATEALEALLYSLEELELVASADCVRAARAFVASVDTEMPTTIWEDDGKSGKGQALLEYLPNYEKSRRAFVLACRKDLGVGRGRRRELT